MGRKNVIIPTDIIVGNFFRIKEEQKTKEGRQRYSISLMSPEKKMLHQKGVKVRIRAAGKEDPKVYEAAEKLIRKNSKIVVEWIKEGSLPQAPSMLLLHIIAEESVQKAYGIGEERKPFLIEALQNLPPLKELEGTADADTLRVVDAVAHTKEDKIGLKRALNIIYDGAVKCGIWKENISSEVLVTARSTTEKADKNLKTRIFTLEELRKLTQRCIEHMDKEALYAALLLQLTTGVKVGELCGLNLSSVWKYEELRVLKIDGKMTQKIKHYICEKDGRIKWQFRLILSAAILSIMLAESRFLYYHSPKDTKWLICIIYALTGYYCPGCGAGRACYCILHGQIYQAFRYNPLLVLLLPWIGAYLALCACQWLFTGRESISRQIPMWILWTILAVILIYGVLRNVNAYPFVLLSPTRVR
mgnify:FL=1